MGLILTGFILTISFYDITYDDVFLAFRYAKNILSGNGFVYNIGEKFLGTPAPFFVLLLVIGKYLAAFLTIPQVGGLISCVSLLLLSLFVYAIGRSFGQRMLGALAAIFTLINPLIVMTLGSETPIYLFFVTAAFYFYYCRGQIYLPAFLLALSILNRVEGIIPAALFCGHFILTRRKFPLRASVIAILTMLPWLIFSFFYFGSPLTNSMGAKIAQRQAGLGSFIYTAAWWMHRMVQNIDLFYLAFIPLLVFGVQYFIKKGRGWSILFFWIVFQTVAYLILDVPFYHWYIAHIGLAISILAAMGSIELLEIFRSRIGPIYKAGPIIVIVLIIFAAAAEVQVDINHHYPNPVNQLNTATGKWFIANSEPGSSIAYLEIGQIGYYSERQIIDLLGLVTPGASDWVRKGNFVWAYLNYQPDYIIYNPMFSSWIGVILNEPWFKESYTEVEHLTSPGYPEPLIIYKKHPGARLTPPLEVDAAQIKREQPGDEIYGNDNKGQTFKARESNMSGIEVSLFNFNKQNNKTVIFHLKETPDSSSDIFRHEFLSSEVVNNSGYLFHFPTIENSSGKSFYFYLDSPESTQGNAISVWTALKDPYKDGTAWTNERSINEKDLAFKVFYKP
ncbi:MAG: hypothetical protein C3F06_00200 [Candidatus Methanoperedenaceae archaeon]|nr:MAG: hypothetical protein C3F06_00200 [Candidatus Methanoperedenaceae archaeon]